MALELAEERLPEHGVPDTKGARVVGQRHAGPSHDPCGLQRLDRRGGGSVHPAAQGGERGGEHRGARAPARGPQVLPVDAAWRVQLGTHAPEHRLHQLLGARFDRVRELRNRFRAGLLLRGHLPAVDLTTSPGSPATAGVFRVASRMVRAGMASTATTPVSELDLPVFDYTDETLAGPRFHAALAELAQRSWVARAEPVGFVVLDREAVAHMLRSRSATFPGRKMLEVQGVTSGPLYERLKGNLLDLDGDDHRRLRKLVQPAFPPRRPIAADHRCDDISRSCSPMWPSKAGATS